MHTNTTKEAITKVGVSGNNGKNESNLDAFYSPLSLQALKNTRTRKARSRSENKQLVKETLNFRYEQRIFTQHRSIY